MKCVTNRGEFSVFTSVVRGNLGNYKNSGKTLTQSGAEKYEGGGGGVGGGGCTLPHKI